jgi:hypothetical protein
MPAIGSNGTSAPHLHRPIGPARPSEVMSALGIVQNGDPILRRTARPFALPAEAEDARRVVAALTAAAERVEQAHTFGKGMGIAAPQIGIDRAAAIVRTPTAKPSPCSTPRSSKPAARSTNSTRAACPPSTYAAKPPQPRHPRRTHHHRRHQEDHHLPPRHRPPHRPRKHLDLGKPTASQAPKEICGRRRCSVARRRATEPDRRMPRRERRHSLLRDRQHRALSDLGRGRFRT